MALLDGKKGLVFGIANERSLGWAIAQACADQGASVGITYANERLARRAEPLGASIQAPICMPCNVQSTDEVEAVFEAVRAKMGQIDFLIHSVAFANREDLLGNFSHTSLDGFRTALEVSCYSLVDVVNRGRDVLSDSASIVTLSYLGSQRCIENYNIMGVAKAALESSVRYLAAELGPDGIRVNTLSAGPVKTLAAAGIPGFKRRLKKSAQQTALKRNITAKEVGDASVFLCSELSSGVTGTCLYVDAGAHFMGLSEPTQSTENSE